MTGLQFRDSFVGNGKTWKPGRKTSSARGKIIIALAVFITVSGVFGVLAVSSLGDDSSMGDNYAFRNVKNDLGIGSTAPAIAVDMVDNAFAMAWYGHNTHTNEWYLNVSLVSSSDGSLITHTPISITQDIYIYNGKPRSMTPMIAWDPDDSVYLLIWYNGTKQLNGTFLNNHGEAIGNFFVINGAGNVDYHAFGLSYNEQSMFTVTWSSSTYDSIYAIVTYNSGSPQISDPAKLSGDVEHSHVNHASSVSSAMRQIAFVWRNYTGSTGHYNITAAVYKQDMSGKVWNDFTVADGFSDGKHYDVPNVVGGDHGFLVVYADTSTYNIYGAVLQDNSVTTRFSIGKSYSGVKYYGIGLAYNGSDEYLIIWPDSNKNIVASVYDMNGALVWHKTIVEDGNSNEAPAAVVDTSQNTYQFVWYDSTNGIVRTSFWTENELVPEFGELAPLLVIVLPAVVVIRNRRQRA